MIWARARVSPLGRIRASTMVKLKANTKPRIREPLPTKAAHMQGTKGRAAKTISWGKEKVRGGRIKVRAKILTRAKTFLNSSL